MESTIGWIAAVLLAIPISVYATPPTITTTALAVANQGTAYSQSLSGVGGTPPYNWTVTVGQTAAQIAAQAGYTTLTLGPSLTVGGNIFPFNFFGSLPVPGAVTQSGPGQPINILGQDGNSYNAALATAVYVGGSTGFVGIAFGGGYYVEAELSFAMGAVSYSPVTTGGPAFWGQDIFWLAQPENALIPDPPAPSAGYYHYTETDFFEWLGNSKYVSTSNSSYVFTLHDWNGQPPNFDVVSSSSLPNYVPCSVGSASFTNPNRYGALYIPGNGSTNGTIQAYFNGVPVGNPVEWLPYDANETLPPSLGTASNPAGTAFNVVDARQLALIFGTGSYTPMTVYSLVVYQGANANNLISGTVPTPAGTVVPAVGFPPGLSLNPATGVISGTPTAAGSYLPTFVLTDANGNVVTAQIPILITAAPGIVDTVAGNGTSGFSGAGGAAAAAALGAPDGVAVDSAGNLYVSDSANHVVWKVNPAGTINLYAGTGVGGYSGDGGGATAAELGSPAGLAIDSAGNLYIADAGNMVVRKVSAAGIVSTFAGNGGASESGDGGSATAAGLIKPGAVTLDTAGNVYIADQYRVRKVNAAGIIATVAGNGVAGTGTVPFSGDGGLATSAPLNAPDGVVVDATGNIYISDSGDARVRKVDTHGIITTVAGGGSVYLTDGGAATAARLGIPQGLALDSSGNLYLVDTASDEIRMVSAAGIIGTVMGNGNPGYSGDGGSAAAATLNAPTSLAIDSAGDLFVVDAGNEVVREVFGVTAPGNATLNVSSSTIMAGQTVTLSVNYTGAGPVSYQWYIGARGNVSQPISGATGATYTTPALAASASYWVKITNSSGVAEVSATIQVNVEQSQTISFAAIASQTITNSPLSLSATASSGLAVSFGSQTPGVCTVSGTSVVLVTTGTCTIVASQSGNASYAAAPQVTRSFTVLASQPVCPATATADFDGTCKSDILWQNSDTTQVDIWLMNGTAIANAGSPATPGPGWTVGGVGDFNGDGMADILWQNSATNDFVIWLMNGTAIAASGTPGAPGSDWSVQGVGDFNGDGAADILWQSASTGDVVLWFMNGTAIASSLDLGAVPGWTVAGVGDFNGDTKADILWQNQATGDDVIWLMNGSGIMASGSPGSPGVPWSIAGIGDFNADGDADILWQNTATGQLIVWLMNGTSITASGSPGNPGAASSPWSVQQIGDFNGDGMSDILFYDNATSQVVIWLMNGASVASSGSPGIPGLAWQVTTTAPFACTNSVNCNLLAGLNSTRINGSFGPGNPAPSTTAGGPLNPFLWSPGAATIAQNYAASCPGLVYNANRGPFGENIYVAAASCGSNGCATPVPITGADAAQAWAAEAANYTYSSNSCAAGQVCTDFTQVVSRTTAAVGCGIAQCTAATSPFTPAVPYAIEVCDFAPSGNSNVGSPY
jgi:sugar lactone lactonase YvrE